MPKKLKLRNAYLRGWFAARADRGLPEADALAERTFLDRGYEAGISSGGHALPLLENPQALSAALPSRDIQAVLDEYRARKAARRQPGFDDSASDSALTPDGVPTPEPTPLQPAADGTAANALQPAGEEPAKPPASRSRKSRWDEDADDAAGTSDAASSTQEKISRANGGSSRRRYGR